MPADESMGRGRAGDAEDQPTLRGLAAGRRVFNRYVLETPAGRGGMGVVWRAHDQELERKVALKFLPEVVAGDAEAVRDLKRETKRCLELTHSNIVRVYDFMQEGPMAAIAMELVDGQSLAKRKSEAPGGCLSVTEVTPLATQLCAALDYAHRTAKVVHRDLKPANLLLTRDGQLKVTDFGIARSLTDTHTRLTGRAGDTSGTLVYMSPQQLMGVTPTVADDIYTLGATLYDLLTGKPPFYSGDIVTQVRELTPPSLTRRRRELEASGHLEPGTEEIPAAWEETIGACLEKEPEDRPQSVAEVAQRMGLPGWEANQAIPEANLGAAVGPRSAGSVRETPSRGRTATKPKAVPVAPPPPEPREPEPAAKEPPPPAPRRSRTGLAVGAAALVVLLLGAGYYFAVFLPVRRARAAAAAAEGAARRLAEESAVPARQPAAVPPAQPEPAGRSAAEIAREQNAQKENNAILTLINSIQDDSTRETVFGTGQAVRAYLDSAPEKYRAEVTAAWFKRRAAWEAAHVRAARASVAVQVPVPSAPVQPAETAKVSAVRERRGGPEPAQPWTVPGSDLQLIWIQPGTFEMGSPPEEMGRYWDEGPQTRVTLTLPFWLGRTEVTQRQWQAVMGTAPSTFKGDDLPVERVSWGEAMEFCRKLTDRERAADRLPDGYEYTLPSEAQWEYACRAGTSGPFGGRVEETAWYADNSGNTTHPVAQKRPNAWGLYDMHGNVWEWCRDWAARYPGGSATDYAGPAAGSQRITRGGAWCYVARNCRSARRGPELPGVRRSYIGFRLALAPVPSTAAN